MSPKKINSNTWWLRWYNGYVHVFHGGDYCELAIQAFKANSEGYTDNDQVWQLDEMCELLNENKRVSYNDAIDALITILGTPIEYVGTPTQCDCKTVLDYVIKKSADKESGLTLNI